jgi:Outer membrane lipoprotein-sorting protein
MARQTRRGKLLVATAALTALAGVASGAESRVFTELVAHNGVRNDALLEYKVTRTYQVADLNGKVHAREVGQMEYQAPDRKTFVVTSEEGSALVRHLALNPLIASEIKAATGKDRHDSSITPENYTLELLGEEQLGSYHCFVARAVPKRRDKYLFEGKVWIDAQDYAVVRIEGHPAAKLSFWIKRADFVRQFQKIDGVWLPQRDETIVDVRLYGKKVLTIDHRDYTVRANHELHERANEEGEFSRNSSARVSLADGTLKAR